MRTARLGKQLTTAEMCETQLLATPLSTTEMALLIAQWTVGGIYGSIRFFGPFKSLYIW